MDIYNALGRDRTLFVSRYLDDESCNQLIASLIWLQSDNEKDPITMYFNVPGVVSKPAMAVFDVMQRMKCPLVTINTGLTVGIGALLCAAGTSGKRSALPNARFLISKTGIDDGTEGQAIDVNLQVQEVLKDNVRMTRELARLCGQPLLRVENDIKRDFYLSASEAVGYGLIDEVRKPHQPIKVMQYRGAEDSVIGYGHFGEARRLKESPHDILPDPNVNETQDFDQYAAQEIAKKGLAKPRKAPSQGDRFAMLRSKPPMAGKPGSRDIAHQPPQSPPPDIPPKDPPTVPPKDKSTKREPNEWDLDLSQNSGF
eukprot:gene8093-9642_t